MQVINIFRTELIKREGYLLQLQSCGLLILLTGLMSIVTYIIAGYIGLLIAVVLLIYSSVKRFNTSLLSTLRQTRAKLLHPYQFAGLYKLRDALVKKANLTTAPGLYLMPGSSMNAFALGSKDESGIIFSEAMFRRLNLREVGGVMAHEIAHIKNHDLTLMSISDGLWKLTHSLCQLAQLMVLVMLPFWLFGSLQISISSLLFLFFAPGIAVLIHLALSRTREFEADRVAAELSGDPQGLVMALKKMDSQNFNWWNLFIGSYQRIEQNSLSTYLRTHPPTKNRLEKLMKYPSQQGVFWMILQNYTTRWPLSAANLFTSTPSLMGQIFKTLRSHFKDFRRF